ncbi:DUF4142 domain-containing protein [Streptomyces sp. NPDC049577]|uniref:DUF4142 domain-containing protein n=1 Tax=Streptomyces sp. NPDC049577 TaxID=3155153 RepID=UPI00341794E7
MRTRHRVTTALLALALAGASPGTALATGQGHDDAFLKKIHQGNLAEIAAGRDSRHGGVARCVKEVGRVLVRDHRKLDDGVKDLAHRFDVSLPRDVSEEQRRDLKRIHRKAHSRRYDRAWLKAQEAGHAGALKLIDEEIAHGEDADVRKAATSARPVVARHLEMVRDCMAATRHRR